MYFEYFESLLKSLFLVSFKSLWSHKSLWSLSLFCVLVSLFWAFFVLWVSLQYKSKILSLSQSKWKLCNASPPFHFVYFPFALISNYIEPHQHTTQPSCNPLAASNYNKRKGKYILLCSLSHCAQLFSFFFSVSTQMLSFYMLAEP